MSDHAQLRDQLWTALSAEPKPVTRERALAIARKTLPPKEAGDFVEWFAKHGDRALEKLNG